MECNVCAPRVCCDDAPSQSKWSLDVAPTIRPECARHESKPTHKQNQHHERIKKARGPKIDVHIGNDAIENKECASDGQTPSQKASSVPEQYTYSDQHRQKR